MQKRKLGRSSLEVFPLVLGGNVFGWTVKESMAYRILDAFIEKGGNFLDTADSYSRWVTGNRGGESEEIIGRWLRQSGKRDKVLIATKVGSQLINGKKGLSKQHILRAAEDSLRRLQTDVIDLYQSHYDDESTPIEETIEAYADLINQGKVRVIGASNFTPERLVESLRISLREGHPAYQTLQPRYNLYDREQYEQLLEPLCREHGLGVITYYSLASGFLTGKYRKPEDLSQSVRGASVGLYINGRGFRILNALDRIAERYQAKPASIALAWIMARPGITAPIASVTNPDQLEELMQAASIELDAESVEFLNTASAWREENRGESRVA